MKRYLTLQEKTEKHRGASWKRRHGGSVLKIEALRHESEMALSIFSKINPRILPFKETQFSEFFHPVSDFLSSRLISLGLS